MNENDYYRITADEALYNAYIAYANTNNPDDRVKIKNLYDLFKKGKISRSDFYIGVQQAAKAQGKTDAVVKHLLLKQDGAHTEKVAANPGNEIDAQGKSEIPNSSAVSDANAAKTQANDYDPYTRLNNNVQYVMNTLKTYGYSQQVRDSFKQNIDKILANTKDNNRIAAANQYIDQFLGDKQDLRRGAPAPAPAPNQQPQKANADAKAAGGTQGVQGAQAGAKTGNTVVVGGVQGSNNGSGKKPKMSDAEINAFLNEELGGDTADGAQGAKTDNGTYASAGVAKGGTKTVGYDPYDPNPGNVSLAYAMRNAPEQERRAALIDEWNKEHGISYVTGKDGLIYRIDPQHPDGYVDPFKNDLSKIGSTGYATGKGMLTSSSNDTYATGKSIKDANGNVLTNPGGDWEYQYALRDPQYGLGMMGKMSDAQKKYLQAVADGMGFNYNFTGAPRYV